MMRVQYRCDVQLIHMCIDVEIVLESFTSGQRLCSVPSRLRTEEDIGVKGQKKDI